MDNGHAEICLAMENVNPLDLWLFDPEFMTEWTGHLPSGQREEYQQWKLEVQTTMDLDTFYETYRDPNNLDCIRVN